MSDEETPSRENRPKSSPTRSRANPVSTMAVMMAGVNLGKGNRRAS